MLITIVFVSDSAMVFVKLKVFVENRRKYNLLNCHIIFCGEEHQMLVT